MSHLGWSWGRHYERRRRRKGKKERRERAAREQIRKGRGSEVRKCLEDVAATGGDVEVVEEGGREFNESSRSVLNTWQRSSTGTTNGVAITKQNVVRLQNPYKKDRNSLRFATKDTKTGKPPRAGFYSIGAGFRCNSWPLCLPSPSLVVIMPRLSTSGQWHS